MCVNASLCCDVCVDQCLLFVVGVRCLCWVLGLCVGIVCGVCLDGVCLCVVFCGL